MTFTNRLPCYLRPSRNLEFFSTSPSALSYPCHSFYFWTSQPLLSFFWTSFCYRNTSDPHSHTQPPPPKMANPLFQIPFPGTPNAPKFDGSAPKLIRRFLQDIELLGSIAHLSDKDRIRATIRYADYTESKPWEHLPEATAVLPRWTSFADAVISLYPGSEIAHRYSRADLQNFIQDLRTIEDLGAFCRSFIKYSAPLIAARRISDHDRDSLFANAFPTDVAKQIRFRLSMTQPDIHPDDCPPMADFYSAACFVLTNLHRQSRSSPSHPATPPLPTPPLSYIANSTVS